MTSGNTVELMAPDKGKSEESTFSEAEKLRRERARMMHTGVTSFKWAGAGSNGHTLLVPLDGALWVLDHANGEVWLLPVGRTLRCSCGCGVKWHN